MAQSVCLDAQDAPRPGLLPFEAECERSRPLSAGDPLPYRKHDWPGASDAAVLPSGYQASDSLRGTLLGRPAILQTFEAVVGFRGVGLDHLTRVAIRAPSRALPRRGALCTNWKKPR